MGLILSWMMEWKICGMTFKCHFDGVLKKWTFYENTACQRNAWKYYWCLIFDYWCWASGRIFSLKRWLSLGMGYPGRWWIHHSWKCSRKSWRWHSVPWSNSWWLVRGWTPWSWGVFPILLIVWSCGSIWKWSETEPQKIETITAFGIFACRFHLCRRSWPTELAMQIYNGIYISKCNKNKF